MANTFTANGVTEGCIYFEHDEAAMLGRTGAKDAVRVARVLVRTSVFPFLKRGDAAQVDSVDFSVLNVSAIGDGAVLEVTLKHA